MLNKDKLKEILYKKLEELGLHNDQRYVQRLEKELSEIEKQDYYKFIEDKIHRKQTGLKNYNCLLFWYLLGMTDEFDIEEYTDRYAFSPKSSMPDIDLDFASGGRDSVLSYLQEKYGVSKVSPIGTMGELKVRSAILDISRQLKIDPQECFPITKSIPAEATIDELGDNKALQAFFEKYPDVQKYLRYLMNTFRQIGTHAGGILVSSENLTERCCLTRSSKSIVTGFRESGEVKDLEYIGFIKFDVLGLSTLDQIKGCLDVLGYKSMQEIPNFTLEDEKVYKNIFHHGRLANIFQLETQLGTEWSKKVKPKSIEDLADISTLIRPGCLMAGVPEIYVKRKFKKEEYIVHPVLQDITKHTHGLLLYQEQIMQLISACSKGKIGLSEAEVYRRKISANDVETIKKFTDKCEGLSDSEIKTILEQVIKQGQYSFNKSHSVSYSTISYYQAFLKYYYPIEFWLAALKSVSGNLDKTSYYINCAKADGIEIMPVDIMYSEDTYTIKNGKIYCGLQMAKGVKNDVYGVIESRNKKPFTDLIDFLTRIKNEEFKFGKRIAIPLVRIGAFMGLCKNIKGLEYILSQDKKKILNYELPNEEGKEYEEYTKQELYNYELEYIGSPFRFNIMEQYRDQIDGSGALSVMHYDHLLEENDIESHPFFGVVSNIVKKNTKKEPPKPYQIVTLSDSNISKNFTVWANELEKYGHLLKRGNILIVYLKHSQYGAGLQRISNAIMQVDINQ